MGGEFADFFKAPPWIACVAGRISVGVLYCFGGRVAKRVGIQVNYFEVPPDTIPGYFE